MGNNLIHLSLPSQRVINGILNMAFDCEHKSRNRLQCKQIMILKYTLEVQEFNAVI